MVCLTVSKTTESIHQASGILEQLPHTVSVDPLRLTTIDLRGVYGT